MYINFVRFFEEFKIKNQPRIIIEGGIKRLRERKSRLTIN